MKSKSPFAMKSPLLAYKSDMRGNYANPKYVKEEIVGVKIGEALTKAGTDIFSGLTDTKPKSESGDGGGSGGDVFNNIHVNGGGGESRTTPIDIPEIGDTDITPDPYVHKFKSSPKTGYDKNERRTVPGEKTLFSSLKDGGKEARLWIANNTEKYEQMLKDKSKNQQRTNTFDANDQIISSTEWQDIKSDTTAMNMKGSPVKHNAGAVGSIGNASIFGGGIAGISQRISNQAQQRAAKSQQSGSGFFGTIAQAAKSQGGSVVGSIGQQMGNQAQQRAADAGGSTGVDPFLPPPNQVAETGSYGGGGDRILEMDSNPVGNQSIGRNTDITSQLFGSGQRASMLAMKGTPLHHDSEKQAHTHPSKTTTKMKPDGEYPGARYVKGDLVDQDDLLDKTELDVHIATQVQSDKKGSFIKEMPDSGPGSNIETDRGFGKKIRLESMGRSSYTSNMKDQLDPHDFLFKNTPKNNKKK